MEQQPKPQLDAGVVYRLLPLTVSHDDAQRKPAEQQLLAYESVPGFASLLLSVVANKTVPQELRFIAVITLKNAVSKNWKSKEAIPDAEKDVIKEQILRLFNEESGQVGTYIALIIGTVARHDYPQKWGNLIAVLVQVIEQGSPLEKLRALQAFQKVVRALASKRLARHRQEFQQIGPQLFVLSAQLWSTNVDSLLTALTNYNAKTISAQQLEALKPSAEMVVHSLKVITDVTLHGFNKLKDPNLLNFLHFLLVRLKNFAECHSAMPDQPLDELVCKWMQLTVKLIIQLQQEKPNAFRKHFLAEYLDYFHSAVINHIGVPSAPRFPERFVVSCMVFMRNVLVQTQYKVVTKKQVANENVIEANKLLASLFTPEVLLNLCKVLITRYFVLTPEELEEWKDDPEEFIRETESESVQDNLKPCAENLFLALLQRYGDGEPFALSGALVQLLTQAIKESEGKEGLDGLLMKETCYRAIGLGAFDFYDHVDFSAWFTNQLEKELRAELPPLPKAILRRRIAALIGEWVMKAPQELRRPIYTALLPLLHESNDIVVRLTAANTLRILVEDLNFYAEVFMEFLDGTINLLFKLLVDLKSIDSKLQVLNVISSLITQMEERIEGYRDLILQCLSELWKLSKDHHLLQSSIVRTLASLVKSVRGGGDAFYRFVVPLIQYGTDVNSPQALYLLEDSLELWAEVLKQAAGITDGLLQIFPNLHTTLMSNFDHVKICMRILDRYILVGGSRFLSMYIQQVAALFEATIGNLKDEGTILTLKPLDTLIQLYGAQALPLLQGTLQRIFSLVVALQKENEWSRATVYYLSIFARVLVHNRPFFFAFFQQLSAQAGQNLLAPLVDFWAEKADSMSEAHMRKLTGLALCLLLPTNDPQLLQRTPLILGVVTSVLADTHQNPFENLVVTSDDETAATELIRQTQAMYRKDPANSTNLRTFCLERLQEAAELNGQQNYQAHVLSTVDPVILASLQAPPAAQPGQ